MTNRDNLAQMNNEELSEWLCEHFDCGDCPIILPDGVLFCAQIKENKMLEWLKTEIEKKDGEQE